VSGILRDGDVTRPIVWIDWSIDDAYQGIEARLEDEKRGGKLAIGDHTIDFQKIKFAQNGLA
jgi:hypothetical protein